MQRRFAHPNFMKGSSQNFPKPDPKTYTRIQHSPKTDLKTYTRGYTRTQHLPKTISKFYTRTQGLLKPELKIYNNRTQFASLQVSHTYLILQNVFCKTPLCLLFYRGSSSKPYKLANSEEINGRPSSG